MSNMSFKAEPEPPPPWEPGKAKWRIAYDHPQDGPSYVRRDKEGVLNEESARAKLEWMQKAGSYTSLTLQVQKTPTSPWEDVEDAVPSP